MPDATVIPIGGDDGARKAASRAARQAGADAVKFQTFRARDLVVPGAPTAQYQARQTGAQDQYAMLEALELSEADHRAVKAHCDAIGIEFFSTPFSVDAVDLLVRLGVRRIKLSSGELTHRALVEHATRTGLPLLLSTGMATLGEIEETIGANGGIAGLFNKSGAVLIMSSLSDYMVSGPTFAPSLGDVPLQ